MNFPKEFKYSKSHEYLKILPDKKGIIGITTYASSELGDIVFVDLPEIGKTYKAGDKFGVVESVKSVADLYIPCNGKIIEINKELSDHPEYANEDPYNKGWMIKVELTSDPNQNKELVSSDEYQQFILVEKH